MNTPFKPYKMYAIYCENGAWYCNVAKQVDDKIQTSATYGPFATKQEAVEYKRKIRWGIVKP